MAATLRECTRVWRSQCPSYHALWETTRALRMLSQVFQAAFRRRSEIGYAQRLHW
jgi:hypothetical protein